jgi:heterodisulfide reductase subunit C
MNLVQFGYNISQPRAVNLDKNDLLIAGKILADMPELQTCIACGSCTATCTAGNLTTFNFRKVHTLVRRGEYREAYEQMDKCMLCGKCRLSCPRGINTRGVVLKIKHRLSDY